MCRDACGGGPSVMAGGDSAGCQDTGICGDRGVHQ